MTLYILIHLVQVLWRFQLFTTATRKWFGKKSSRRNVLRNNLKVDPRNEKQTLQLDFIFFHLGLVFFHYTPGKRNENFGRRTEFYFFFFFWSSVTASRDYEAEIFPRFSTSSSNNFFFFVKPFLFRINKKYAAINFER